LISNLKWKRYGKPLVMQNLHLTEFSSKSKNSNSISKVGDFTYREKGRKESKKFRQIYIPLRERNKSLIFPLISK